MRPVTVVSPANIRILTEGTFEVQPVMYSEKSSGERIHPWGAPVLIMRVLGVSFPASLAAACLSWSWTDWMKARRAGSVYLREDQAWWYRRPKGWDWVFHNKTQNKHIKYVYVDNFAAKQDNYCYVTHNTHTQHTHTHTLRALTHTQTTSLHLHTTRASYQEQVTGTLWFCHLALIQTAMTLCGDIIAVYICLKSFSSVIEGPCARSNENIE